MHLVSYSESEPTLVAKATVRGYDARPPVVLTVDSHHTRQHERQLVTALRSVGFLPVSDTRVFPNTLLPRLGGLTAYRIGAWLSIHDSRCGALFRLDSAGPTLAPSGHDRPTRRSCPLPRRCGNRRGRHQSRIMVSIAERAILVPLTLPHA